MMWRKCKWCGCSFEPSSVSVGSFCSQKCIFAYGMAHLKLEEAEEAEAKERHRSAAAAAAAEEKRRAEREEKRKETCRNGVNLVIQDKSNVNTLSKELLDNWYFWVALLTKDKTCRTICNWNAFYSPGNKEYDILNLPSVDSGWEYWLTHSPDDFRYFDLKKASGLELYALYCKFPDWIEKLVLDKDLFANLPNTLLYNWYFWVTLLNRSEKFKEICNWHAFYGYGDKKYDTLNLPPVKSGWEYWLTRSPEDICHFDLARADGPELCSLHRRHPEWIKKHVKKKELRKLRPYVLEDLIRDGVLCSKFARWLRDCQLRDLLREPRKAKKSVLVHILIGRWIGRIIEGLFIFWLIGFSVETMHSSILRFYPEGVSAFTTVARKIVIEGLPHFSRIHKTVRGSK